MAGRETVRFLFFLCLGGLILSGAPRSGGVLHAQEAREDALEKYRNGRIFEDRGRASEAEASYREAVQICLDEISNKTATMDTYVVLTWTLQRQKKYNEVISRAREALKISADSRIHEIMGEAFFYLDDYNSSLSYMKLYVGRLPSGERVSTAYFFIGEIYRLQKKFHYADIAYTTAVSMEPNFALWWYRLGLAREGAGEKRYAAEAYRRSIKLNPNYDPAIEGLSRVNPPARSDSPPT